MTRVILTLAALCVVPLSSCDWPAPAPTAAELAEQAGIEHEKLRHLLAGFQIIESSLQKQLQDLTGKYGPVEAGNVYQGIDLTRFDGIRQARQRLKDFSAKYDALAAAQEQHFKAVEDLVRNNDLSEPLASEFQASLSLDKGGYDANYRAWFSATRVYVVAVDQLLDPVEQRAATFRWHNNQLVATDAQTATQLRAAQESRAPPAPRLNEVGRGALDTQQQTLRFIRSSILKIEQGMSRREGN
jgi:hypothetical protein